MKKKHKKSKYTSPLAENLSDTIKAFTDCVTGAGPVSSGCETGGSAMPVPTECTTGWVLY